MGSDFTSLEVYQLAEELIVEIYKISSKFPKEEIYGITSQVRRATISIALNIAESCGRYHFKDKSLFLYNARGSLLEVKSLVFICFKLKFIKKEVRDDLTEKINKLGVKLNNFIKYLKSKK